MADRAQGAARAAANPFRDLLCVNPFYASLTSTSGTLAARPAPKVAALVKQPHVALTIDTMGPPARQLLLRGTASIEIVDGVPPEYLAAAAKSTRGDELAAFEANVRALYKQMARITITPSWARFYDFGAGRLPAFLRRLVEPNSA